MSAVSEKINPKVVELCRSLKKGALPLSKLPESCRSEEVLGYALADGLIQVGRQMYSLVPVGGENSATGKLRKIKNDEGKMVPARDEQGRFIVDKEYTVRTDNEWSWMTSTSTNRKALGEVLVEEMPEGIELHAKLTNEGLKATL